MNKPTREVCGAGRRLLAAGPRVHKKRSRPRCLVTVQPSLSSFLTSVSSSENEVILTILLLLVEPWVAGQGLTLAQLSVSQI